MDNANGHTINLANSIIGVSILAMPYCFRQCGVLLSICLLLISSIISRLACHFLLKSAIIARRKTFEFLAFHIFGSLGKFSIEIGMIGFLLGTCIAFFVVMGDLGPAILSEMTGVHIGNALRNSTLMALAVFCVLPLGLLRNVDSLNGVSTATIGFYCCLVLKIIIEALPHIFTGDWVTEVILWRPAGVLQCLPIFSMALFCQTQLFEIYQAIPNASLEKMNSMIRVAVNMCTWVYIFVGAFGYIAFFQKPFTGNILLSFVPSITSDIIKLGFVLSLAFSFPLVIFPCRASLYSLLYKGTSYINLHEGGTPNYIPEGKFKMLTLVIVSVSLTIGIMIPSIELVLGLIGSTIGVMICVLFPVTCFICISPKNTNERILAQIMLFVGIIVMVLGTYANLQAVEEANLHVIVTAKTLGIPPKQDLVPPEKPLVIDIPTTIKTIIEEIKQKPPEETPKLAEQKIEEIRHEPPQPEEPAEKRIEDVRREPPQPEEPPEKKNDEPPQPEAPPQMKIEEVRREPPHPEEPLENKIEEVRHEPPQPEPPQSKAEEVRHELPQHENQVKSEKPETKKTEDVPQKKIEEVDIEAIKKEDTELKEQEDKKEKQKDPDQILIDTIKKQNEVQQEIVQQQKKLIEVIEKQRENVNRQDVDKVNEEKVKAVKEIEDIAKRAIESISGKENQKKPEEIKIEPKKPEEPTENKTGDVPLAQKEIKMLPLPIALAKMNNLTGEAKLNKTQSEKKNEDVKEKTVEESEVKAMRREILSENTSPKPRMKREASMETLNKAVKEVCSEISKSPSTEKPIIKMLCKLSEPGMQAVDLQNLENVAPDLQPQKRDLKQVSKK